MSTTTLFQSLLESVHDTVYITDIREENPSLKECYCLWVTISDLKIMLKNDLVRHDIVWNLEQNTFSYNGNIQPNTFLHEVTRILNIISKDLQSGNARAFRQKTGGVR